MNTLNKIFLCLLVLGLFTLSSCKDDDPVIEEPEELITTLVYNLTSATADDVVLKFEDLDGDGGNAPVLTVGALKANTVYTGSITLANESESPAEDITEEIGEEQEEHQFFFETTVTGLNIEYTDADADGNPVGLSTTLSTGDSGTGTLRITLKHEPKKSEAGVADGDITNAGGNTDIEVLFDITIE